MAKKPIDTGRPAIVWLVLIILAVVSAGVVALTGALDDYSGVKRSTPNAQESIGTSAFSNEAEVTLKEHLKQVVALAANPDLIEALQAQQVGGLSQADINARDQEWQAAEGITNFMQNMLNNDVSRLLTDWRSTHSEFPEVFVTNERGVNLGLTNKTSDYYQADEDWWVQAYARGKGKAYHGILEFDESANSLSVALYAPVYDDRQEVIGVIKAVLDIFAIAREL